MQKSLAILLQIQKKDIKIRALVKEAERAPQELNNSKQALERMQGQLSEVKEVVKKLQVARKQLEIDLDSHVEEVNKYEVQLTKVKTNEEYKALQKQIADAKFKSSIQEDKILEKMEEIEKTKAEVKKNEQEVTQAQERLRQREKEVARQVEQLKVQQTETEKEKELLLSQVEGELIETYTRIFANKADRALVAIDNNTCAGCHMKLPPNVVNETKKAHKLIVCENCARILYWSE